MTVEQARELCIEAHKGQWRYSEPLTNEEIAELTTDEEHTLEDGINIYKSYNAWFRRIPYHTHPIAVAEMMSTDDEKIVALLHDVEENTKYTLVDNAYGWFLFKPSTEDSIVKEHAISKEICEELNCLFHHKGTPYLEYLEDLVSKSKTSIAIKVKLADIAHNLSDNPTSKCKAKYLKGIKYLLSTL